MKKICKNCKHFNQYDGRVDDEYIKYGYGQCECDKFKYDTLYCDNPEEKDLLFYSDYEGYSATIEVGEKFGCIHFKEK